MASLAVGEICPPEPCIGLKTSRIGSKAVGMGAVPVGMGAVTVRIMLDPVGIMPDSVGNHDSYSLHRACHSLH